jgi:hypothetical protein
VRGLRALEVRRVDDRRTDPDGILVTPPV